jgi:hypothetical protein
LQSRRTAFMARKMSTMMREEICINRRIENTCIGLITTTAAILGIVAVVLSITVAQTMEDVVMDADADTLEEVEKGWQFFLS